jgi:RNA polymerase sigma-70 factor (ECF subfamily)
MPSSPPRLPAPEVVEALVRGLKARDPVTAAQFYDRYAPDVQRILARVLGADRDLSDLLQEVFLRALSEIDKLEQPDRLRAWLGSVAVFTARGHIRKRRRQRWLFFLAPEELSELRVVEPAQDVKRATRAVYDVLERLPTEERIAFALRFIEQLELQEVADACRVSLATIKRRLSSAEQRFTRLARAVPELADWLGEQSP